MSCVADGYVGVSLQCSANEPLVSSLDGGAEAMLPRLLARDAGVELLHAGPLLGRT